MWRWSRFLDNAMNLFRETSVRLQPIQISLLDNSLQIIETSPSQLSPCQSLLLAPLINF
jgi:hypothetical protein